MRCPEFQSVMRQFLDGSVDKPTKKAVAWHLAECEECARLINDDRFWDDAVLSLFGVGIEVEITHRPDDLVGSYVGRVVG